MRNRWLGWAAAAFVPSLVAAAVAVGSVANASAAGSAKTASGKITLRLMTSANNPTPWKAWAASFHKANRSITIKEQFVDVQSYPQTLATELQAGDGPDLMYMQGGWGQLHAVLNLAKARRLVNLSSQPWVKSIPKAAQSLFALKGKMYGLPLAAVPTGLVYNTGQFAQDHLTPPTTFSQLLSLCQKVKALGKAPMVFAGATFDAGQLGQVIAASTVYGPDPNWNAQRAAGKVTFAGTRGWTVALNDVVAMNKAGCFSPDSPGLQITGVFSDLASQSALMWATGPTVALASVHAVAPTLKFQMVPFPGRTVKATRPMVSFTDSLGVNSSSSAAKKAAAIKFIDFVARKKEAEYYAQTDAALSVADAATGKHVPAVASAFAPFLKAHKTVLYPNAGWPSPGVYTALGKGVTGILTGQVTNVKTILQAMDQAWGQSS